MRIIIYARTSTANGAGNDSLGAQEDVCRAWATEHGHDVVSVFVDDGLSGRLAVEQRPGLLAALMALEDGQADGLVVHRLDRLARELHVQEAALAQAWGAGEHVAVFEAVEGEIKRNDPDDPQRTFLRQVLGAAAELERGLIRARLQGGRRRKAARGEWVGGHRIHPRYGYRVEHGAYVPVEAEQRAIRRMAELRASGSTYRAIVAELVSEGIDPPPSGTWHPTTVRKVLMREDATTRAG